MATSSQLASWPRSPLMVMCDTTPRMRARSSSPKPFMTESTVMSTVTPSAMPIIELSEMKEMK